MNLLPIFEKPEENEKFLNDPLCQDTIHMCIEFYKKVGFNPPWICYYVEQNGDLVGSAAFKGKPVNGTVEIAYGTQEKYRNQGIGSAICKLLVDLSLKTDPSVKITARTFPEENFSVRLLRKNNFLFTGIVNDPEDGDVWEWVYQPNLETAIR
ncbi:MAG TPA: GNAT family protein [Puia sp.]|nr:GNAT family protein [Puia sp.]